MRTIWWAVRGAFVAVVVTTVALRPPNIAALTVARAFGARILREGGIPLRLGNESFGAPHAWDGGLDWLGALASLATASGGPALTAFAACVAALAAFAFVELRARRRAGPAYAFGAAVLAAACASDALRAGGGIENAAFAAALYLLLDRPGPRGAGLATLLTIVWCNTSAQGLLAPALGVVAALGATLDGRVAHERRWAWAAALGTALATLATPAGATFPALAWDALRLDRGLEGLVTYHPADVSAFAYRTGFTLAILTALLVGAGRLRPSDALLWLAATLLALANGTYLAIFGVLVAPLLAASAAERFPRAGMAPAAGGLAFALVAFALAGGAAGIAAARPAAAPAEPAVLARVLVADGRPHRLFCAVVDWCDVAEAAGAPLVSAYMDGRVEAFPPAVRTAQLEISRLKRDWRGRLDAARIDAVIVRRDHAFATLVAARPAWRLSGETETLALYVRRP